MVSLSLDEEAEQRGKRPRHESEARMKFYASMADALATSEWDGERYVQYIYGYQGQLCELFTAAEYDFAPEDGEPVCAAQAFEPTLEGDLLTVRVTDETGHVSTVYIARRCAQ